MKNAAFILALTGIVIAILTYVAHLAGLLNVKTFFTIGLVALGLMIAAASFFLIIFLVEWARENDFFRRLL